MHAKYELVGSHGDLNFAHVCYVNFNQLCWLIPPSSESQFCRLKRKEVKSDTAMYEKSKLVSKNGPATGLSCRWPHVFVIYIYIYIARGLGVRIHSSIDVLGKSVLLTDRTSSTYFIVGGGQFPNS